MTLAMRTPPTPNARLEEWRRLAEQGLAAAQFDLGVLYENGDGVRQDYVEAVNWYRLSAEQGYAMAQNNLAGMYARGLAAR